MPETLPLFPLQTVFFPGMVLPLHIFEPRYRTMFAARAEHDPIFGIVLTRTGREVFDQPEVHAVGTGATLLEAVRHEDGRVDLAVRGGKRFRVLGGDWAEGYLTASVEWLPEDRDSRPDGEAVRLAEDVRAAFVAYLEALERATGQRFARPAMDGAPEEVAYAVCAMMPFGTAASQRLLEAEQGMPLLREVLSSVRKERDLLLATGIGGSVANHLGQGFSAN
jgi:hypothetical protein